MKRAADTHDLADRTLDLRFSVPHPGVSEGRSLLVEMKQMTLQVESNAEAPGRSRSLLAEMKSSLEPRYDDVLLVVSELVTNSVRHSDTKGIDVKVETGDHRIRVEVSDDGPGFTIETPRGDGMGLSLVDKLSEDWGLTSSDRFTVWAELSRSHSR